MILLRAGESMDQSDLMPTRMERARLKVADLATERKGQPLGLVSYAGSAHLVLPPTRDTEIVATMASEISPEVVPKMGDDVAAALDLARRILGTQSDLLVVVADTVNDHDTAALAEFRANSRLPVYFLAVARAETPELNAVQAAASSLGAPVTLMSADSADVRSLVRRTASPPGDSRRGRGGAVGGGRLVARPFDRTVVIGQFSSPVASTRINRPVHDSVVYSYLSVIVLVAPSTS